MCFIVGTVYVDMPGKPNVLEDVGRDVSVLSRTRVTPPSSVFCFKRFLPEPAPRSKYISDEDAVMLEDESGRVQLVGDALHRCIDPDGRDEGWGNKLVTGIIMAALGHETDSGSFEVSDVCFAGMAPMLYKSVDADGSMDMDG